MYQESKLFYEINIQPDYIIMTSLIDNDTHSIYQSQFNFQIHAEIKNIRDQKTIFF